MQMWRFAAPLNGEYRGLELYPTSCAEIVSRLVVYEPAHIVIAGKARSVVMPG